MSRRHDHTHAGHDGHGHRTGVAGGTKIAAAALLTGGFMVAEVLGGVLSGSLALLADAGHMLTDFASLALAWFAIRISRRPATWRQSYGFDRFSVLAAFVNGLALFVVAAWICWEAYQRLQAPAEILGGLMLGVAVAGLAVNVVAFWILTRGEAENLNIRAAALHVMGDMLGSTAAIAAAVVVMTTGWTPIDPLLSVFVALIILRAAWHVVRESGHILLEGAPAHLDHATIIADLSAHVPDVVRIDHVHAWSITEQRPMITLEAETAAGADANAVRVAVKARLRDRFGVAHATVEVHSQGPATGHQDGCAGAG